MTASEQSDLVLRLAEMSGELRQLIIEGRGMIKDINNALAEARRFVKTDAKAQVTPIIETEVVKQLEEMGRTVKRQMDLSVARVRQEFDDLGELLLEGRKPDGLTALVTSRALEAGRCLKCGQNINASTAVNRDDDEGDPMSRPFRKDGDVSICGYCGHIAVFTGLGQELRRATKAELDQFMRVPEIRKAQKVVKAKPLQKRVAR